MQDQGNDIQPGKKRISILKILIPLVVIVLVGIFLYSNRQAVVFFVDLFSSRESENVEGNKVGSLEETWNTSKLRVFNGDGIKTEYVVFHSPEGNPSLAIDGEAISEAMTASITREMEFGTHTVWMDFGEESVSRTFVVRENCRKEFVALLKESEIISSIGCSTLVVKTKPPGASVIIDGERRGLTPATIDTMGEGSHSLLLQKDGYYDSKRKFEIEDGGLEEISVSLKKNPSAETNMDYATEEECAKQQSKKCLDDGFYWVDACGRKKDLVEKCQENSVCAGDKCACVQGYSMKDGKCEKDCSTTFNKKCVDNMVYVYDACGNEVEFHGKCPDNSVCVSGSCRCKDGYEVRESECQKISTTVVLTCPQYNPEEFENVMFFIDTVKVREISGHCKGYHEFTVQPGSHRIEVWTKNSKSLKTEKRKFMDKTVEVGSGERVTVQY